MIYKKNTFDHSDNQNVFLIHIRSFSTLVPGSQLLKPLEFPNRAEKFCRNFWIPLKDGTGWNFPGVPVAKTPRSQCKGPGFDCWSGR